MLDIDNMSLLTVEYEQNEVKRIVMEALKENVKLYIHDQRLVIIKKHEEKHSLKAYSILEGVFDHLTVDQIKQVKDKYPNAAAIYLNNSEILFSYPSILMKSLSCEDSKKISELDRQLIDYDDIWINKAEITNLFKQNKKSNSIKLINENFNCPQELIELTCKALEKFWHNHDPNRPPKKEVIIRWLKEQGVTEREAKAIDTIIRPNTYKKGGNKSQIKGDALGQKK